MDFWGISGWVIALFSMIGNIFQWITQHHQSEKSLKFQEEARHQEAWNDAIEPLKVFFDEAEIDISPQTIGELPKSDVRRVAELLPPEEAKGFLEACANYDRTSANAETHSSSSLGSGIAGFWMDYTDKGRAEVTQAISSVKRYLERK